MAGGWLSEAPGTFLSPEEKGHGTLGRLLRGLLSSGSQLCLHELVVRLLVEAVGWGSPVLAVMGVPWGTLRLFVCVGSSRLSLTPLTPSQEPEGVWLAAGCWEQRVWPGSVLPCRSTGTGSQQVSLPLESPSPCPGVGRPQRA